MTQSLTMDGLPGCMKCFYPCFSCMFSPDDGKSAALASRSTQYAATSPELDKVTGKYYDTDSKEQKFHPTAYDPEVQKRILDLIASV